MFGPAPRRARFATFLRTLFAITWLLAGAHVLETVAGGLADWRAAEGPADRVWWIVDLPLGVLPALALVVQALFLSLHLVRVRQWCGAAAYAVLMVPAIVWHLRLSRIVGYFGTVDPTPRPAEGQLAEQLGLYEQALSAGATAMLIAAAAFVVFRLAALVRGERGFAGFAPAGAASA